MSGCRCRHYSTDLPIEKEKIERGICGKVSKLLGHEDVSTTAKHYHYTESLRRGVDILEACYNSATRATEEAKVSVKS